MHAPVRRWRWKWSTRPNKREAPQAKDAQKEASIADLEAKLASAKQTIEELQATAVASDIKERERESRNALAMLEASLEAKEKAALAQQHIQATQLALKAKCGNIEERKDARAALKLVPWKASKPPSN
ncbi:hypothetical protein HRR81_000533 [Exophiala dermatitidis]|uniref:Uncharacterized protein n=1 Tax=Exophiala dermatitidis (strain ATCC 34100 / CBS 525.76 / NIH/UT8656) TaxID=858893 RepID=H6C9C1_EXODN|nr:uncharacterized protein HMPREF1120_08641 [Exophiala dermatitidis NIH/UT8656]KAJ4538975.1 hypothetical protein HRR78_007900 [Exophiala dermatitidis]EHY60691.1 hypothetical protein HMPREF1120_08641 [Exophiala dermatitidis NIH/UT8656]KAJ4581506.1 hypothetical protein HRR79_000533 [Exophiala dermatitidis]KAJ4584727.1 hypothetical protein HRR81_000533 [Exophiala dermatitidis]KAJ9004846.1 hypothetical protein HRR94_000533 [Exophiala dermatitidis]